MELKNIGAGASARIRRCIIGRSSPASDPAVAFNRCGIIRPIALSQRYSKRNSTVWTRKTWKAGGVYVISEAANMPSTPEAIDIFLDAGILYGLGKAANAGGVAVSGLEMAKNSERLSWTRERFDSQLQRIMRTHPSHFVASGRVLRRASNYVVGANCAGFRSRSRTTTLDQGLV